IAYEAPHRVLDSLRDAQVTLGERRISIARELTKIHEEVLHTTLSAAIMHFEANAPRGEFTFVFGGASSDATAWDADAIKAELTRLSDEGWSGQDAIRTVTEQSGWRKRDVYALWVTMKE
ncbi:MAG: rRNA (cytidine-2'-O-)-methyltransferase, partial [Chloroflexi bacterium]|nr:rRNA (cytidine-2'-O-)-methyltransferase [Chloroflexota bacterium]